MLKTLLLSTQKIKGQQNISAVKNLTREKSPSLISSPPSKNRRYSSVWSASSSPSVLQQHDSIDTNSNIDCSNSATALITALSRSLKNNAENKTSAFIPNLDIKNIASLNNEKFKNQLNQHNGECAATTSSCASSPLKMKNEDEEMDEDDINLHQQNQRHSTIFSERAIAGAFDSDLMTLSHYHQQQTQLQNIAVAAAAQQQNSCKYIK